MKIIKFLLLLLLLQQVAWAQNSIRGNVYDKDTKEPLLAATVYIPDLKIGATCDTAGAFSFTNIARGKLLLQVKLVGYATRVITANTSDTLPLAIYLSQAAGELQEVVVTGISKGTEIRRSPVPVVAIDKEYLLT